MHTKLSTRLDISAVFFPTFCDRVFFLDEFFQYKKTQIVALPHFNEQLAFVSMNDKVHAVKVAHYGANLKSKGRAYPKVPIYPENTSVDRPLSQCFGSFFN